MFGEVSRQFDEASRQRAQQFGEGSRLFDETSSQRGQLFGEETQGRREQLAGRQQFVGEAQQNIDNALRAQQFNRETAQQNFGNQRDQFGMERQSRQDFLNEGSVLADEAFRRRATDMSEQQGQWNRNMQQENFRQNASQQDFGNLERLFGMERQGRQDYFNEGNILSDEASRRRAQMYGEQQGQWNRDMQQQGFQQGVDQQGFQNNRQLFNESMQRRQQGVGEYLTSRNQPLSELQCIDGYAATPMQQPYFPNADAVQSYKRLTLEGYMQNNYQNQIRRIPAGAK